MVLKFNLTVWGGHISEGWAQIAGRMYSNYNRHLCELADLCLQEVLENLSWETHSTCRSCSQDKARRRGSLGMLRLVIHGYTTKYNEYTFHNIPNHSHSFPTFPHDFNMTSWHHIAPSISFDHIPIWKSQAPLSHPNMKIPGTTGGLRGSVATVGLGGSQAVACHWHDGIEDLWRKTAELKGTETTHAVPRCGIGRPVGRPGSHLACWIQVVQKGQTGKTQTSKFQAVKSCVGSKMVYTCGYAHNYSYALLYAGKHTLYVQDVGNM